MMFDKDNTNFNGECLCKTCKWAEPVYIGVHRIEGQHTYICVSDQKDHKNVGVCKYYSHFNESEVFNG